MRRILRIGFAFGVLALLNGCGGGGGSETVYRTVTQCQDNTVTTDANPQAVCNTHGGILTQTQVPVTKPQPPLRP